MLRLQRRTALRNTDHMLLLHDAAGCEGLLLLRLLLRDDASPTGHLGDEHERLLRRCNSDIGLLQLRVRLVGVVRGILRRCVDGSAQWTVW